MKTFIITPLTEEEKEKIAAWKYSGNYAMYNLPQAQEMKEKQLGFYAPNKMPQSACNAVVVKHAAPSKWRLGRR